MAPWLIAACGLAYAWVAVESAWRGNWPLCVVYAGYAFSNIGLYVIAK